MVCDSAKLNSPKLHCMPVDLDLFTIVLRGGGVRGSGGGPTQREAIVSMFTSGRLSFSSSGASSELISSQKQASTLMIGPNQSGSYSV